MEENTLISKLMKFGLTRQAASIYLCLLSNNEISGYEVSKITGISRSNVYSALAGLVDDGAAYLLEGTTNKYVAVDIEDFCQNKIRHLMETKKELIQEIPKMSVNSEGYITIKGHRHIVDKIHSMFEHVEYRIYISIPSKYIEEFRIDFEMLVREGKKVVILTDNPLKKDIDGCVTYITGKEDEQLKFIVDSSYVLTGDMCGLAADTCLYCGQKNFVKVFKDSLSNEIKLIELMNKEKN